METEPRQFASAARRILRGSPALREAVTRGTLNLDARRRAAYAGIDAERWRRWAAAVKNHLLTHLDRYLEQAEERLTANGAVVHWAAGPEEVHAILRRLAEEYGVRTVVKGKSMLSEEMGVNPFLESRGIEVFETDLGEYIIQLLREPPSHSLAPAIHRGLEEIRQLFSDRLGTASDASPDQLAAAARSKLRAAFLDAEMGITGGNFLVAETGTLALIENEGNIRITTSMPRVHVALVGIEKLLPRLSDLAAFLQLTSRAATGQRVGTFVSLIRGPRGPDEADGPEAVHVILVDHGRSAVLRDADAWETLRCVRCAACLNVCPVFRQTGGHPYGWAYSGPIGAVLAPGLLGLEQTEPLVQASSLCGACAEACPVRIPIPKLLLTWRQRAAETGLASRFDRAFVRAYAFVMTRPRLYRAAARALRTAPGAALDNGILPVVRAWSAQRAGLTPSEKSFRELWEEGIA